MSWPCVVVNVRSAWPLLTSRSPHSGHFGRCVLGALAKLAAALVITVSTSICVRITAKRPSRASSISVSVARGCSRRHCAISAPTFDSPAAHRPSSSLLSILVPWTRLHNCLPVYPLTQKYKSHPWAHYIVGARLVAKSRGKRVDGPFDVRPTSLLPRDHHRTEHPSTPTRT